jgi:hypothetical protein
MARKRLSNVEKHAIQGFLLSGIKVDAIAKELKVPESLVNDYVAKTAATLLKIQQDPPAPEPEPTPEPTPMISSKDLILNKTSAKENRGVAIMTEGAASRADHFKKSFKPKMGRVTKGAIYNIDKKEMLKDD